MYAAARLIVEAVTLVMFKDAAFYLTAIFVEKLGYISSEHYSGVRLSTHLEV